METQTETILDEADEAAVTEELHQEDESAQAARMVIGWIVAAVLIFLAQRDLRRRTPELVRGPVGLWRVVAMVPPGAVAYLVIGRRRAPREMTIEVPNSIAA